MQRVVALANAHHLQCFPNVRGTNVAVAAALHLYATLPNVTGKINPPMPFLNLTALPIPCER